MKALVATSFIEDFLGIGSNWNHDLQIMHSSTNWWVKDEKIQIICQKCHILCYVFDFWSTRWIVPSSAELEVEISFHIDHNCDFFAFCCTRLGNGSSAEFEVEVFSH